jgi:hypothetical protein
VICRERGKLRGEWQWGGFNGAGGRKAKKKKSKSKTEKTPPLQRTQGWATQILSNATRMGHPPGFNGAGGRKTNKEKTKSKTPPLHNPQGWGTQMLSSVTRLGHLPAVGEMMWLRFLKFIQTGRSQMLR